MPALRLPAEPSFNSYRSPVLACRGMVAASQPLAAQAGLAMLMAGGNAADAAVATAAALDVTEPKSTSIGGDCFALFYDARTRQVSALNGSGRAPAGLTLDVVTRHGLGDGGRLPIRHAHTITVPGACAGWCDLIARHGSLPLPDILAPAIRLAEDGYPVAPLSAHYWAKEIGEVGHAAASAVLTLDGRAPRAGQIFRNPGLARTYRAVAAGGKAAFYTGAIARSIARAVQAAGGVLAVEDLAAHTSTWVEPISVEYRGLRVWECPPNGQGLAALLALNILAGFDLAALDPLGVDRWHVMIEAMRLAFADARRHVSDPAFYACPLPELLSPAYAAQRRRLIDLERAMLDVRQGTPEAGGGTVYFCTVDGQGNACSFINSNYQPFGSGIVPEDAGGSWGFTLHNRGWGFSLDPEHPNALAPRKRPYHTIIPGLLTRPDGSLFGPFGVMGAFMQPQGHVQVVVGMVDDGLDPQAALNRPRFRIDPLAAGGGVLLEAGLPAGLPDGLRARGHPVEAEIGGYDRELFGRGQIIRREPDGVLWAGSDPRADGCALGY
jgi:gamma-glutamyltranspeptidase/glutathione hydrolase